MLASRKKGIRYSLAVALVTTVISFAGGHAKAESTIDNPDIIEAFSKGSMQQENTKLQIKRLGHTTVLHASLAGSDSNISQSLVCALCSPREVVDAAWTAGNNLIVAAGLISENSAHAASISQDATSIPSLKSRRNSRLAISLGGIGAALAAAGAVLLIFNNDCSSSDKDVDGNCRLLQNTGFIGWSFVGTGLITMISGLIIGIVSKRQSDSDSKAGEEDAS